VIESKRKKDESFESFLRRFNKRIQQSGALKQARGAQYHKRAKSDNLIKRSALISLEMGKKYDYLRKVGKLKDENRNRW
jgi:ribosomal protein S21